MGNSLRRTNLAPAVEYPHVVRFAEALRAAHSPRSSADLRHARELEPAATRAAGCQGRTRACRRFLDTHATGERLVSIADETLIAGKHLYRDVDDEGRDESSLPGSGCRPPSRCPASSGCSSPKSTRFPGSRGTSTAFP